MFKSATADDIFLVQMTNVNIRRHKGTCVDSLTVIDHDETSSQIYKVSFCWLTQLYIQNFKKWTRSSLKKGLEVHVKFEVAIAYALSTVRPA